MNAESNILNAGEEAGQEESNLQRKLHASKTHALRVADEFKSAAEAKAREWAQAADQTADQIREKAEAAFEDTKVRLESIHKQTEGYVREHPLKSVLVALGAGFLVGLLTRK